MDHRQAREALKVVMDEIDRIHFKKGHRGSCIRPACTDVMRRAANARYVITTTPREAPKVDPNRPTAFAFGSEHRRSDSIGALAFYDAESGMRLDAGWTGTYIYYWTGEPSLMRTWFDKASGERAFACISATYLP